MEEDLELVKRFFNNKESQGDVELNGESVTDAFSRIYASLMIPKHTWLENNGIDKPLLLGGWFGMVKFRDGEKRLASLDTLPNKMWIHTEEPDVMSSNSVKKRMEWNNQIVAYYIHEI